jgi:hypothetical protein
MAFLIVIYAIMLIVNDRASNTNMFINIINH